MELQQLLTDKGYNPGPVDGIIGAGTQGCALRNVATSITTCRPMAMRQQSMLEKIRTL